MPIRIKKTGPDCHVYYLYFSCSVWYLAIKTFNTIASSFLFLMLLVFSPFLIILFLHHLLSCLSIVVLGVPTVFFLVLFSTVLRSEISLLHACPVHMKYLMVMSSTILEHIVILVSYSYKFSILQWLHPYKVHTFFYILFFQKCLVSFRLIFLGTMFITHKLLLVLLVSKLLSLMIVF